MSLAVCIRQSINGYGIYQLLTLQFANAMNSFDGLFVVIDAVFAANDNYERHYRDRDGDREDSWTDNEYLNDEEAEEITAKISAIVIEPTKYCWQFDGSRKSCGGCTGTQNVCVWTSLKISSIWRFMRAI